jgi:hypothetical protein
MERKEFKSEIASWVDSTRAALIAKICEFMKGEPRVVLFQPCIMVTEDEFEELYYNSYSEILYEDGHIFLVNEDGGEESIDCFTLDEILRVIDNL